MLARSLRYARRSFLAAAALLLSGVDMPSLASASHEDGPVRQEVQQFLQKLASDGIPPYILRPALAAVQRHLPTSLLKEMQNLAQAAFVSFHDLFAYNALEGLPLSAAFLSTYLPQSLVFVVPREGQQAGLMGAALLSANGPTTWQVSESFQGLMIGTRLGLHLGISGGTMLATLAEPAAPWLGPGVPTTLAARLCLQRGHSPKAALRTLTELQASRRSRYLLYDPVEATAQLAEVGDARRADDLSTPLTVLIAPEAETGANMAYLREALAANLGWLTAEKALRLLQRAAPDATCVVLNADERTGVLVSASHRQEISF